MNRCVYLALSSVVNSSYPPYSRRMIHCLVLAMKPGTLYPSLSKQASLPSSFSLRHSSSIKRPRCFLCLSENRGGRTHICPMSSGGLVFVNCSFKFECSLALSIFELKKMKRNKPLYNSFDYLPTLEENIPLQPDQDSSRYSA